MLPLSFPRGRSTVVSMDEKEERNLASQIDAALPAVMALPLVISSVITSVVWVESEGRQDILNMQTRLSLLGAHFSQLNELELRRIYGQTGVRWIYAFGKQRNAFFLWIKTQVPSFERPFLTLPALQAELVISFNVDDPSTVALLRSIVGSRSMFVQFAEVPNWVRQLPPLSSGLRGTVDYGKRGKELVHSSLPLEFRPDVIAKMGLQLEALC